MKISLGRKILIGFIACVIILAIAAFFSFRNSRKFIDTAQWVNHTQEVLNAYDQLLAATVDGESGVRGYVISGNTSFLEPYNQSRSVISARLNSLQSLTRDNNEQQENIKLLRNPIDRRAQNLQAIIKIREQDFEKARTLVSDGDGKALQDEIRQFITNGKNIENILLIARKSANEQDAANFDIIFSVLLVIIAIVLLSVYLIIISNLRALRKAERETADKNWLLTGSAELNDKIRGERTVSDLAGTVTSQLCNYLDAQLGLLFIAENGRLQLSGSYALSGTSQFPTSFRYGEGLTGQAALEQKAILFSDIPPGYTAIRSASGEAPAQNIIALPLLREDKLVGVVEIASARKFSETDRQLLDMLAENIAIALTAAQSRARMKDLLEETQRQAEELEAQQEELKQSNEELQEKTGLLERSEAELKAQQEELQQSNEELEEKANLLEEQKEQLEKAKTEVEKKAGELELTGKYKSEFLANMSHELRTPLNSILILSQLLGENKNSHLNEKETEFARNIYNSGADLLSLINEILDLSKIESGKTELDISPTIPAEIIAEMSGLFSEVAKNKSINFSISQADDTPAILHTDQQRLSQVLKNLLSNAFKFTGKNGTVRLELAPALKSTRFRNRKLASATEVIAFAVTDNGIGIPAEKLEIVFEAFQQADGSTKRKYGGTGLGLSISRELAQALGGEIQVESAAGAGSCFTLYLPVSYSGAAETVSSGREVVTDKTARTNGLKKFPVTEQEADDDRSVITGNDRVILIMEDDKEFAAVLLGFVRERNYKGILALQGNTGLSYARHYKPDAILLDMQLPVTDGAEVLRRLKADPELRHIPVQIISGYDRRRESLELGAFDFLRKPAGKEELQQALDKMEDFITRKLKKLLIVEDNTEHNQVIRELIGNGDVKSFSAYSGEEAFRLMKEDRFDCVIVDLGLPGMTGFELLEKIKADTQLNKIPVIVYTGKDLSREENNRLMKYANSVVLKTADSRERLLDETMLFLHRVESKLPREKQHIIRKLHKTDEVLLGRTVLLADDDIRNIYSLTNVLEEEGMTCLTAENGRLAMQVLEENPSVEIVLLDIMMPEMDGYETIRAIRDSDRFSKLPVIALTAKAMKGDREKCLEAGMSDYISKPVNIEQLLSLLRVWLYR